ncbi:hypothetical protein ACQP60_09680 [Isoptericola variabilis]|uniref:hypothetical protein n=1 Tax=Isoptericola variabilis TaxID=139208 RepID=UPI003D1DF192
MAERRPAPVVVTMEEKSTMALEAPHIRQLAAELAAPLPRGRELAAENAAAWASETMPPGLAAALSRLLEVALVLEDDETAMEAELNALSEMSGYGLVPRDVIERVLASREWAFPWATDLVEGLREDLPVAREQA